jgi:hypothetical protein
LLRQSFEPGATPELLDGDLLRIAEIVGEYPDHLLADRLITHHQGCASLTAIERLSKFIEPIVTHSRSMTKVFA